MAAMVPAGNGGPGRFTPAALPLRARVAPLTTCPTCCPAFVAAAGAVLATLLLTGVALPQAEWLALPERVDEMRHRPRDFWPHFAGLLLALCGLDCVSDLAGVAGRRAPGGSFSVAFVIAVKITMAAALVASTLGLTLASLSAGRIPPTTPSSPSPPRTAITPASGWKSPSPSAATRCSPGPRRRRHGPSHPQCARAHARV